MRLRRSMRRPNLQISVHVLFPGAVIDGVSLVHSIFCGVRASEVVEASGSILFRNVKIEPAEKGRSLNSRPIWP